MTMKCWKLSFIHTTLFAIKGSNNKKTNKPKKKKRNKPLQDKSNTTGQHNSIVIVITISRLTTPPVFNLFDKM